MDKLTMLVQQHSEELSRTLASPVSDLSFGALPLKSDLANNVLGFDSSGDPIAATGIANAVSSYIATLIDDASAADARSTLGIDGASGNIATGDLAAGAVTVSKLAAAVFKANRNLVINGNMAVAQRGTSIVSPPQWEISSGSLAIRHNGSGCRHGNAIGRRPERRRF